MIPSIHSNGKQRGQEGQRHTSPWLLAHRRRPDVKHFQVLMPQRCGSPGGNGAMNWNDPSIPRDMCSRSGSSRGESVIADNREKMVENRSYGFSKKAQIIWSHSLIPLNYSSNCALERAFNWSLILISLFLGWCISVVEWKETRQPEDRKVREAESKRERDGGRKRSQRLESGGKLEALVFTAVPPFWISFATWPRPTAALTH